MRARGDRDLGFAGRAARDYLAGQWLEELAYFAVRQSGADEAYFQQRIEWRVDGVTGTNEIDVIARRGGLLSFTSCKAYDPRFGGSARTRAKLRQFLLEADYWDTHFFDGKGRAVLMVTADLIDEARRNGARLPTLFARAKVLNVDIVSLDFFQWDSLVGQFREHWR